MKTVKLGELAEINPRGENPEPLTEVSFVGMAQLNADSAVAVDLETRSFAEVSKGYTVFKDKDILAAKITPCWENGKIGRARLRHEVGVGSTEFHVIRPGEGVDPRYLLHFLRQDRVRRAGELRMTGSGGQRRVPVQFLRDLDVPLMELKGQRRIAETLDEVDAQRSRRRVQVDSLDALVRSRLAAVVAQAPAGPALGDVAAFVRGVTFKPADVSDEGVPVMRTKNVQNRLDLSDVIRIPADLIKNEGKYLRPGDTLVSSANSYNLVGKCCFVGELPERSAIGGFVAALRPGPDVDPVFLHHWFNSDRIQETVRSFGNQTTNISNLNIKRTLTLRLPDVPLAAQREFAAVVAKIDAQRERIERALALEDELFASLQYRAFRGEL